MIKLQLDKYESTNQIREALIPIYEQTEFDFRWLEPITKFSLDEYLVYYLSSNPPQIDKFKTLDLSEHLADATNLINKSNSKKNEIVNLETQALTTGIAYIESINNIPEREKLANLNLRALFKLTGESENKFKEFSDAQNNINANVIKVIKTKLCLHNQKGNSLNYGERVEYARAIYCDNIKCLYERFFAIKRILLHSFKQQTRPLPNYLEIKNSLDELVWWLRDTFKEFQSLEQNDYIIERSISLSKKNNLVFRNDGIVNFEINDSFLDNYYEVKDNEWLRILGVSISLVVEYKKISSDWFYYYDQGDYCTNVENKDLWKISWADTQNSNMNNARAEEYAVKANFDTENEKLLYISEVTPPLNELPVAKDTLFNITKEEEKEAEKYFENLKKNGQKIDWTKVKNIEFGLDGRPKLEFYPDKPIETIAIGEKFFYGPINPLYKSSINFSKQFFSGNQIKNILPFGNWELKIKNVSLEEEILNKGLEPITHVILTFKLGVRNYK